MVRFRTPHRLAHALRRIREDLRRIREDQGQALVEYALLLSLIAIATFISVETFGLRVASMYSHIVSVYP
jgi:Flp pilus assembly pilin Flp